MSLYCTFYLALLPLAMAAEGNRNVFLVRALEKILSERETRRNQHAALKSACETALSKPRPDS